MKQKLCRVKGLPTYVLTSLFDLTFLSINYAFTKVTCQTEDGVRVDSMGHLSLEITRPNGTAVSTSIYRKPTQNREGVVTFQSIANRYLEEAGQWSIICQYNEYRDRLKSVLPVPDHVTRSLPVQFVVHPGKSMRFTLAVCSNAISNVTLSSLEDIIVRRKNGLY